MSAEKRLSVQEEERLWAMSAVPLVPVLIYAIVYYVFAISSSFEDVIRYGMLALMLYLFATYGIYEIVSSFKAKRALSFRVKRFLSRASFATVCVLCFYGLWSFFTLLFSSVLKVQYILLLSLLTLSLLMAALVRNPRTRRIVKKLTQEEASYRT